MKSNILFLVISICLAAVVIYFPVLFVGASVTTTDSISIPQGEIIVRTLLWSIGVGLISTIIGFPIGLRLSSVKPNFRIGIIVGLLITLAIPAYACFYAWWQLWPAGTWLHSYFVKNSLVEFATKTSVVLALVGWSLPIPALISYMSSSSNTSLSVLNKLDGLSLRKRFIQRVHVDKYVITASIMLVATITAVNTTCFDLSQIHTIGNELRAVIAVGGTVFDVPYLSFIALAIAVISSIILLRFTSFRSTRKITSNRSCTPIIVVWFLLSGAPLALSALGSINSGMQLWKHYYGDIATSLVIGLLVSALSLLILITSSYLHLSTHRRLRVFATFLDFSWLIAAFLPASLMSYMVSNSWNQTGVEIIYQSIAILVLAHLARVGFVASIAGRWVASSVDTKTLSRIDSPVGIIVFIRSIRPRIIVASCAVVGISIAMSIGEVALTSQLSPPSSSQPISVALLNAMHYQRPQMVTSALFFIIALAAVSGIVTTLVSRKILTLIVLGSLVISCNSNEQTPVQSAQVIGGVGLVDGRFIVPRAIDANEKSIVVIDKSGRIQLFDIDGTFKSTYELELSGTGFPTGVSIDSNGMIWIADTHQNRVVVIDMEGEEVKHFGSYGTGEGQFIYPTDIAFGENGEVFVSEYGGNDRISVFDQEGNFLRSFGRLGEGENCFKRPQSIAIESTTGNLYIADAGNHRIVVCNQTGEVIKIISSVGRSVGNLLYPYGLVFESPSTFLVCEYGNNRLQRFNSNGDSMGTMGGAGSEIGLFKTPWAVVMTKNGVLVADTGNNRLQAMPDMMINK